MIHAGHSTGGGEVALSRKTWHQARSDGGVDWRSTTFNVEDERIGGLPIEVFDEIRTGLRTMPVQFYKRTHAPFYGYNCPGAKISEGIREHWWLGMMGGIKPHYDCIKAFPKPTSRRISKSLTPTLILHGDDDQIVPIGAAALLSAKVKNATLKVYPGFPHGMCTTHPEIINADLLSFIKSNQKSAAAG